MSKSRKENFLIFLRNFFSLLFRLFTKENKIQEEQNPQVPKTEEKQKSSDEFNEGLSEKTILYSKEIGIIQPEVKYENATDYIKAIIKKEQKNNNKDYQDIDLESPNLILNLMGVSSNSHRFPKDLIEKAESENVSKKVIEELKHLITFSCDGSKPIKTRSNKVTLSKRNSPEKVQKLLRQRREYYRNIINKGVRPKLNANDNFGTGSAKSIT